MRRVWLATVPSLCPSFVQWFNAFVDWVVISWELLWTLLIWLASPCRRASRRKRAISKLYITGLLSSYNLGHKGWKEIILYTFCSSPPLCNVDKNLSSNTSLHFTIFQHWKGEWGFDTYSVDITIIISCFWHFPTQFVQDCSLRSDITKAPVFAPWFNLLTKGDKAILHFGHVDS